MSGGFFRGTTADQDTRFSNKQAKLLKTQKFPPELEHLVDVSKVKMDVIKPWIAKRVTEFLGGFEDEVLINFIYGLLEGKEINGKAVQIQLTGFMEKNTGKFMKELWGLLISAQNNASGVPQQFLDAKEEETRKNKAETDRITDEIQKRKDKEADQDKRRKMDGGVDDSAAEETKRRRGRRSDSHSGDENGAEVQNGFRGRNRSPRFANPSERSPSPHRGRRSRSISKSHSNSRSYSKGRSVSKSISPPLRRPSVSPEAVRRTSQRSISPRKPTARGSISPRQRSRSRSLSNTRRRSPSPPRRRRRSPMRRRSPSPFTRRSRSPVRRRSPLRRRRSPSPWRRRSPAPRRHRSPSPVRQQRRRSTSSPRPRSPIQRKRSPYPRRRRSSSSPRSQSPVRRLYQSPVRRRSPYAIRRRSPSPYRRGSPLTRRHRSPTPVRRRSPSPVRRKSPVRVRRRSPSRSPNRSVSSASRSSPSPDRDGFTSPLKLKSPRLQTSLHGSPTERIRLNDRDEPVIVAHRPSMAMSPQRDHSEINRSRRKAPSVSPSRSPEKSPSYADSPKQKNQNSDDNRRLATSYGSSHKRTDMMILDRSQSPLPDVKGQRGRQSDPHNSKEEIKNSRDGEQSKYKSMERGSDLSYGGKKRESLDEPPSRLRDTIASRQNDTAVASMRVIPEADAAKKSPQRESVSRRRQVTSHPVEASKSDEKRSSLPKNTGDNSKPDALVNPRKKRRSPSVSSDSESEGSDKRKVEVTEKKHKRSSRREVASGDSSSDSEIEDRKEAKRRKKDEKKLRKEERRRRRDERRRKREEKRASKRKRKDTDALSSDLKKNEKADKTSNGERMTGKYSSEEEEIESKKKKLEIELREKALEMHRAKKGIHH